MRILIWAGLLPDFEEKDLPAQITLSEAKAIAADLIQSGKAKLAQITEDDGRVIDLIA